MNRNKIILLLCAILTLSCSKGDLLSNLDNFESEIVLLAGSCGATKIVKMDRRITRTSISKNICVTERPETTKPTDEIVFQELIRFVEALDMQRTLIQECARCYDGADYMVTLRNGSTRLEHTISLNTEDRDRQEFITFLNSL